ncbi:hypothetical protein N8I84_38570 [Streptomyces cynarae]|uniref:Uncharacterized protein n=1 Tax=Streptomyces cynarae TaxID=2981134 RepID=A0ABY6EB84_9ACTN|nr:hypothetical protein N8I84_38570 [Streptomyces cynarae]
MVSSTDDTPGSSQFTGLLLLSLDIAGARELPLHLGVDRVAGELVAEEDGSTSMPFIVMIRHRVYGSQWSGSIGCPFSSRQLRS